MPGKKAKEKKAAKEAAAAAAAAAAQPQVPEIEPFVTEPLPAQQPPNGQIEQMFQDLLTDLDMTGEKRAPLEQKDIAYKWNFIKMQHMSNSQAPSPEYLLRELRKNVTAPQLDGISVHLSTSCISWSTRFLNADGHLFLLYILSHLQGKLNGFEKPVITDGPLLESTLVCIRNICNSSSGGKLITKHSSALPLIINSIFPQVQRSISIVMEIILVFLFQGDEDQTNRAVRSFLENFKKLKRQHHGWKVLAQAIENITTATFETTLASFLNGILFKLNDMPSFKFDWLFEIENANVINLIFTKHGQNEKLVTIATSMQEELSMINRIFAPVQRINPFNKKDIYKQIFLRIDPKDRFMLPSTLLGLLDLSIKHTNVFKPTMVSVYNLVQATRIFTASGESSKASSVMSLISGSQRPDRKSVV